MNASLKVNYVLEFDEGHFKKKPQIHSNGLGGYLFLRKMKTKVSHLYCTGSTAMAGNIQADLRSLYFLTQMNGNVP